MQWLVLIYSLPPLQARTRAFVCRELKQIGAVDLRDGVSILPETPARQQVMQAFATDAAARASAAIADCESAIRDLPCAVEA